MSRKLSSKPKFQTLLLERLEQRENDSYLESIKNTLEDNCVEMTSVGDESNEVFELLMSENDTVCLTVSYVNGKDKTWNFKTFSDFQNVGKFNFTPSTYGNLLNTMVKLENGSQNGYQTVKSMFEMDMSSRLGDDEYSFDSTMEMLKNRYKVKTNRIGNLRKYDIEVGNYIVSIYNDDGFNWSLSLFEKEQDLGNYTIDLKDIDKLTKLMGRISKETYATKTHFELLKSLKNV